MQCCGFHLWRARFGCSRKYAHKIPFMVKINHNELLTYPNKFDQIMFGTIDDAYDMGAAAVGATVYTSGLRMSARQIVEVAEAFAYAHELGMATILWCYLRNSNFKQSGSGLSHLCRPHRSGQPHRE
jgi:fructose-bisphosphate aldolase, class I